MYRIWYIANNLTACNIIWVNEKGLLLFRCLLCIHAKGSTWLLLFTGLEYWTRLLDWKTRLDYWTEYFPFCAFWARFSLAIATSNNSDLTIIEICNLAICSNTGWLFKQCKQMWLVTTVYWIRAAVATTENCMCI